MHMLRLVAYYKASVKICNRNALFVTTCGRFVNNATMHPDDVLKPRLKIKVRSENGHAHPHQKFQGVPPRL